MNDQQTETPAFLDEGLTAHDGRYRVEKGEHHDRIYLYEPEFTHDEALRSVAVRLCNEARVIRFDQGMDGETVDPITQLTVEAEKVFQYLKNGPQA